MKPSIQLTLILCATLVATMPIVAQKSGGPLADAAVLCYLAYLPLSALMIVSAVGGNVFRRRADVARGFDVVPTTPADVARGFDFDVVPTTPGEPTAAMDLPRVESVPVNGKSVDAVPAIER